MNKKIKNKEKIRVTITESARALTRGGIGILGSYAYFTDKVEAKKRLSCYHREYSRARA
ncbi:hypothetical protein [[Clostridium] dakarense]|uniref:hypothetical protein n=1 Tax=Faecalimicrobium dakarense TaxID=1301100 RepID=UPI0004AD91C3|nr:hypothetical protein [[Clostridium] dakarense]